MPTNHPEPPSGSPYFELKRGNWRFICLDYWQHIGELKTTEVYWPLDTAPDFMRGIIAAVAQREWRKHYQVQPEYDIEALNKIYAEWEEWMQ